MARARGPATRNPTPASVCQLPVVNPWTTMPAPTAPTRMTRPAMLKKSMPHHSASIPLQPLAPQDLVIVLREPMRLVAHILQQPQRRRVPAQAQRLRLAGPVNLLLALRQRDQARRLNSQQVERLQRRVQLPLAAVNEKNIGERRLLVVQAA